MSDAGIKDVNNRDECGGVNNDDDEEGGGDGGGRHHHGRGCVRSVLRDKCRACDACLNLLLPPSVSCSSSIPPSEEAEAASTMTKTRADMAVETRGPCGVCLGILTDATRIDMDDNDNDNDDDDDKARGGGGRDNGGGRNGRRSGHPLLGPLESSLRPYGFPSDGRNRFTPESPTAIMPLCLLVRAYAALCLAEEADHNAWQKAGKDKPVPASSSSSSAAAAASLPSSSSNLMCLSGKDHSMRMARAERYYDSVKSEVRQAMRRFLHSNAASIADASYSSPLAETAAAAAAAVAVGSGGDARVESGAEARTGRDRLGSCCEPPYASSSLSARLHKEKSGYLSVHVIIVVDDAADADANARAHVDIDDDDDDANASSSRSSKAALTLETAATPFSPLPPPDVLRVPLPRQRRDRKRYRGNDPTEKQGGDPRSNLAKRVRSDCQQRRWEEAATVRETETAINASRPNHHRGEENNANDMDKDDNKNNDGIHEGRGSTVGGKDGDGCGRGRQGGFGAGRGKSRGFGGRRQGRGRGRGRDCDRDCNQREGSKSGNGENQCGSALDDGGWDLDRSDVSKALDGASRLGGNVFRRSMSDWLVRSTAAYGGNTTTNNNYNGNGRCCYYRPMIATWRNPFHLRGTYTKIRRDVSQTPFHVQTCSLSCNGLPNDKDNDDDDGTSRGGDGGGAKTGGGGVRRTESTKLGISSVEEEICPIVAEIGCGGISRKNNEPFFDDDDGNGDGSGDGDGDGDSSDNRRANANGNGDSGAGGEADTMEKKSMMTRKTTKRGGGERRRREGGGGRTSAGRVVYGMCKFHASGREDMDVRMVLGGGFIVVNDDDDDNKEEGMNGGGKGRSGGVGISDNGGTGARVRKEAAGGNNVKGGRGGRGRPFVLEVIDAHRLPTSSDLDRAVRVINHEYDDDDDDDDDANKEGEKENSDGKDESVSKSFPSFQSEQKGRGGNEGGTANKCRRYTAMPRTDPDTYASSDLSTLRSQFDVPFDLEPVLPSYCRPRRYGRNPNGVGVSGLRYCLSSDFGRLQSETEDKVKWYGCLCWSERPIPSQAWLEMALGCTSGSFVVVNANADANDDDYKKWDKDKNMDGNADNAEMDADDSPCRGNSRGGGGGGNGGFNTAQSRYPLRIAQATPLRVLHRRSSAVRTRSILTLETARLDSHWFALRMSTEAGTYVKEFCHGDCGRTIPSVSSMLGEAEMDEREKSVGTTTTMTTKKKMMSGARVDIVRLDCEGIAV